MVTRRRFIRNALVTLATAPAMLKPFGAFAAAAAPQGAGLAAMAADTRMVFDLLATIPSACSLRVVARSGEALGKSGYTWHGKPDGGACFTTGDGGWIYVSNCESSDNEGGVGALRFSSTGDLLDAYPILSNTSRNCAGGKTPWGTWLSCEENGETGQVYECDPEGQRPAVVRPGLGSFNHEAAAIDPATSQVYLTEDVGQGCLYRFTPQNRGDLANGVLEVAVADGTKLTWAELDDPMAATTPLRMQVPNAARFDGGEGIVYGERHVYFTTKTDNRVWSLNLDSSELKIVYDAATSSNPILTGVDNIEISHDGELLIAEDGGDMQIVVLDEDYNPVPLVTLHAQWLSEITGPAFSPDGSRLYFSSQRGFFGSGMGGTTYELTLPA